MTSTTTLARTEDRAGYDHGSLPSTEHTGEATGQGIPLGLFFPAPPDAPMVTSPESAADVLAPRFHGLDREACLVAILDTKHRLLGVEVVSIGSVDHTFMSPREVFRKAVITGASAVVVAHNHPSGDCEPSADDRAVTNRLNQAGELMGIDLLDHLVFGGTRWTSIARLGGC